MRALAATLPRSEEGFTQGRVKSRVGRMVVPKKVAAEIPYS